MHALSSTYKLSGVLIFLILQINQENGETHHCATYGSECDPRHQLPCCDPISSCKLKDARNNYFCSEKTALDSSCFTDQDCSEIIHAKCSAKKKCVCRSNNIRINETYCAPSLGGFCWKNEMCATINALCVENECRCRENCEKSGDQCLPVITGIRCRNNEDCDRTKLTECTTNNTCVCSIGTAHINNTSCLPMLDVYCKTDNDCKVRDSVCENNACQCRSNHASIDRRNCKLPYLGMPCTDNTFCESFIDQTICSKNNTCIFTSDIHQVSRDRYVPELKVNCHNHDDCIIENSECIDNECQCKLNYKFFVSMCVPTNLNKYCTVDNECNDIAFSYCSPNNECVCLAHFVAVNGTKCGALLDIYCSNDIPCWNKNSQCISNKCQCRPFFMANSNGQCLPIRLGEFCERHTDCMMIQHSRCSINGKCNCQRNYISLHTTVCAPLLGGHCSGNDECYIDNSVCIANNCQCKAHYIAVNLNTKCELLILGKKCFTSRDCVKILNSVCSLDKICVCRSNYFALSNYTCGPILNTTCSNNDGCLSGPYHCTDHVCQCKPNFTAVATDRCIETHKLYSCDNISQCSDSWHWQCSIDGLCVCNSNNITFGERACLPILNGLCWMDSQCMAENSDCIDFHCKCKPGYIRVADNHCMPTLS